MTGWYDMGMTQITFQVSDEERARLEEAASADGKSLDAWITEVTLRAAEQSARAEAERMRQRLAEAGLLWEAPRRRLPRPDRAAVERARKVAGKGKPLSDYVIEGRG